MSSTPVSVQLLHTSSTHHNGRLGDLYSTFAHASEVLISGPLLHLSALSRSTVLRALSALEFGQVTIIHDGEEAVYGAMSSACKHSATIVVRREAFWTRIILSRDLGFAEAYINHDFDCEDMPSLLKIIIANRSAISLSGPFSYLCLAAQTFAARKFFPDIANSRANISSHYDIGNVLFENFLSKDMNYSTAIWRDLNGDLAANPSEETLEEAQRRKMLNIIQQAGISKGERVLEIGTGWAALAILAVQTTNCTVDTLTLSVCQRDMAIRRIEEAGLSDQITVHLLDYRDCLKQPLWHHAFDKFISVEMVEHVGKDFLPTFWSVADWTMKSNAAVGVIQATTLAESEVYDYDRGIDFIQKWVFFPGCYIPSCHALIHTMYTGCGGRLTPDNVSNIGPHYSRTLREWKSRFLANFDSAIAPALQTTYGLSNENLMVWKRKWLYYLYVPLARCSKSTRPLTSIVAIILKPVLPQEIWATMSSHLPEAGTKISVVRSKLDSEA